MALGLLLESNTNQSPYEDVQPGRYARPWHDLAVPGLTFKLARGVPRSVIALGTASFFTDLSSEMIYPLLPVFLAGTLGAGPAALGLIEGIAETVASLLKLASGAWTDRTGRRKGLVVAGYGLSGIARPLIGLAGSWLWVLALRVTDRVGKGLRTSPRDALITDATDPAQRGAAFGLHRAMDHAGAVGGPLIAAGLLGLGMELRQVFLLAAIPAAIVLLVLVTAVREGAARPSGHRSAFLGGWTSFDARFRHLLLAFFVFTLGNSADAFVLLKLSEAGVPAGWIAALWSLHHVVKMASSYAGGRFSDRVGRKRMILAGWTFYAFVYGGFALCESPAALITVFLAYGLFFGLTEPVERAWVGDSVEPDLRGRAFGWFHLAIGIGALPGNLLFGEIWRRAGSPAAFGFGAAMAAVAALILLTVPARARTPVSG